MRGNSGLSERKKKTAAAGIAACLIVAGLTLALTLYAMRTGSIAVSWGGLLRGLLVEYDPSVAAIYDLRFPRILVALLAGATLAASGLLLQAALRNPLADPGIIGVSGGAAFTAALVTAFFPALYFSVPVFACLGGILAFLLIYALSWKGDLDPVRIILVGVAVSAVFAGLTGALSGATNASGVSLSVSGLSQRSWGDVRLLGIYAAVGLVPAFLLAPACNLMALDDQAVRGLGVSAGALRAGISAVAVLLVSAATAIVGVIGFLALIVPHAARKLVGSDHRILTPFSILLGAFVLLLADTAGRLIAAPYEIPAAVVMSVAGGPFFIFLLRKGDKIGR
ncbi:MAG: iron ABC transporter permease [Peptococcaceae bacterium]|jgi:iron complex transport system permease protein|nr:iron ABC transporter permease [Peptococcaceae bacterium]